MITKLKWLSAYWTREVVPAVGATIGKIFYTFTNTTGRREQYVIDLDANTIKLANIDASPASTTGETGTVTEISGMVAPQNDLSLYIANSGAQLPVMVKVVQGVFTQNIANGGSITATNIKTGVTITGTDNIAVAASTSNVTFESVSASNLLLNTTTGAVTVVSNTLAGVATLSYIVRSKYEPSVYVSGTVSVTIAEV